MVSSKKYTFIFLLLTMFSCNEATKEKAEIYTCPMHPQIEMDHEGECPICGMKLIKKEISLKVEESKEITEEIETFLISEEKQKLIGLSSTVVNRGTIERKLSFSGRVAYNPDLYSSFTEYKMAKSMANENRKVFIEGSRLRLIKLGLSDNQIQFMNHRKPEIFLTGREGANSLAIVQVYESDIAHTPIGTKMEMKIDAFPEKTFYGNIVAVGNLIDENTRTVSVWCEVKDPSYILKPQMFLESSAKVTKKNVLRIPKEAVFPNGKKSIVYLKKSNSKFAPIVVKEGFSSEEWTEITDGLSEGDEIVSKANFLLDSEAKLQMGEIND